MRKTLSILIGKIIIKFMNLLKFNASVFPGAIAKKIYPDLLYDIEYPKLSIFVTGSTGKGSTTKVVTQVLRDNNYKVITNDNGSNLINAFITLIIKNSSLSGKTKGDALVYEVDERFLKIITKYLKPNYLIINNITRDQPPRNSSFDVIFEEIKKGLYKNMHLIVNGDDPLTKSFELYHKGKITYFGIDKNFMSTNNYISLIKDNLYCPKCHNKLKFNYFHYGSVGDYHCEACSFKRDINYLISDINKNDMTIKINKNKMNINNYILFNLYNLVAAYSVCDLIGIDSNNIIESLENIKIDNKIYEEIKVNNRKYYALNCKAENNATYNLSLIYTALDKEIKTVVIGLGQISRRYNHFDLSWLYDIDFELLENIDKIICAGPYKYDIATRIKLAGIDEKKIIMIDDLNNINNVLAKTKGNVYGILNFDYIKPFKDSIKGVK